MRSRDVERVLAAVALLATVGMVTVLTLQLGPMARRVPIVIATPTLALLALQLLFELAPREETGPASGDARDAGFRVELAMFAWLAALPVLVLLLGILVAAPAYTLPYLRLRGRESWPVSIGMAAALGGLCWLLFRVLLPVPIYEGRLWPLLGL